MSIYADTQTPSHFAWLVNTVAGIAVARVREVLQLIKNRRDAAVLAGLDDRMLADIGVSRSEIESIEAEAHSGDRPTRLRIVAETRHA